MIKTEKINAFFKAMAEFLIKLRYLNILIFILVLVFAFTGMKKIRTDSGWDKWMLKNSSLNITEHEFKEIFGNNDYVAVMVESDDIFKPQILAKIRELGDELEKKVPFSDDIRSITDCEFSIGNEEGMEIINLVPDEIPQSSAEMEKIKKMALSKELIKGKLISSNSKQSWIILRLHPFPDNWRHPETNKPADFYVGTEANKIIYQDKYKILNPKPTGMPVLAADKMNYVMKEMKRTMMLSIFASIIVLAISLRSFKGVLLSVLAAISGVIILFGFLGHFGVPFDASMTLVPIYLGMAVSVAYSIHIFTFFNRQFQTTGNRKEAVLHAIEDAGWPILFTALTTAGAMFTFRFVDITPIQWVGTASTFLVLIILAIALFIIPSVLAIGKDKPKEKVFRKKYDLKVENAMGKLGEFVLKNQNPILFIFFIVIIALSAGLYKFEVSFDLKKTMGLKVPYVQRLQYINDKEVGSLYSYNLVVKFPEEGMAKQPDNLEKFDKLINFAQKQEYNKKITSIVEIIKDLNRTLHDGDESYYKVPDTREMIAQIMLLYENAGGREADRWMDYGYKRFRMMIELHDYNSYWIKKEIEDLEKQASKLFPNAVIEVSGTVAQFTFMQNIVSQGQVKSFLLAIFLITLMMVVVTGSFKTGIIAMIPNITPALAVGGVMGWAGIPLDIMTITIMPMLLGLAVDDTIHFISHSKLEFERHADYRESIIRTFKTTGIPLLFTSVIISVNFLVYTTSTAKVYFNLGFLTAFGILAALVTDYFVTPALIQKFSPFGAEENKTESKINLKEAVNEAN